MWDLHVLHTHRCSHVSPAGGLLRSDLTDQPDCVLDAAKLGEKRPCKRGERERASAQLHPASRHLLRSAIVIVSAFRVLDACAHASHMEARPKVAEVACEIFCPPAMRFALVTPTAAASAYVASCAAVCLASALLGRRPSGEFGMLSWLWSGSGRTVCAERFGRIALPRLCRDVCFSGAVLLNFRFFNRLRC